MMQTDAYTFLYLVKPTAAIMGAGLGKDVALITDGRFSGASHVSGKNVIA